MKTYDWIHLFIVASRSQYWCLCTATPCSKVKSQYIKVNSNVTRIFIMCFREFMLPLNRHGKRRLNLNTTTICANINITGGGRSAQRVLVTPWCIVDIQQVYPILERRSTILLLLLCMYVCHAQATPPGF